MDQDALCPALFPQSEYLSVHGSILGCCPSPRFWIWMHFAVRLSLAKEAIVPPKSLDNTKTIVKDRDGHQRTVWHFHKSAKIVGNLRGWRGHDDWIWVEPLLKQWAPSGERKDPKTKQKPDNLLWMWIKAQEKLLQKAAAIGKSVESILPVLIGNLSELGDPEARVIFCWLQGKFSTPNGVCWHLWKGYVLR